MEDDPWLLHLVKQFRALFSIMEKKFFCVGSDSSRHKWSGYYLYYSIDSMLWFEAY